MRDFEELDYRETPLGGLSLRRRRLLSLGGLEIFEVKLGEAFLMSSLFHKAEVALANLALAELRAGPWDVVVPGLGLGYTAQAALQNPNVRSLLVIEALDGVIEWHEQGLVPLGPALVSDERCRIMHGDFFQLAASPEGFDPAEPGRLFHAVLLDIDHSPANLLHPRHAAFYRREGLRALKQHMVEDGIFAQWSDDSPDEEFLGMLDEVFGTARAHIVNFDNPLIDGESASTIYLAERES